MYKWTPQEIDEQELEMLLDYVIVSHKTGEDGNQTAYIDEVMQ